MKSKFYLPLIAMAIGMIGCTNDLVEEVSPIMGQRDVIAVSVDNADTRTSMSGINVVWSEDDAIGIFVGSTNNEYELISDAGTTSGDFQSKGLVVASAETLKEAAYFPYVQGATWDSSTKTITTSLPATYEYAANTNNNAVMAALMADDAQSSISFQNAGALYAITVENIPAGYNKAVMTYLDAEDNVGIAGAATITFVDGVPTLAVPDAASAQKTITITFEEVGDKTFYFPMPVKASGYASKLQFSLQGQGKEAIKAPVFTQEPVRSNLYAVTLKLDAVSGGIVSEANDIEAANAALANDAVTSVAVKDVSGTEPITIPAKSESADVPHTIDLSEAELPTGDNKLTINVDNTTDNTTVKELTVVVPDEETAGNLVIYAPGTTVTIQSANGTVIETIEATTAENTLIIGEGVTIKNLTIKQGNVVLKGNVESIESEVNTTTTITLVDDITLAAPITLSKGNVTFDLGGKTLTASAGAFVITDGTFAVKNGTIDATVKGNDAIAIKGASESSVIIVNVESDATVKGGDCCVVVYGSNQSKDITINTEGTLVTESAYESSSYPGYAAISANANSEGVKMNVTGGSITAKVAAIYFPCKTSLTISDGTITGATAVYQKSGELTISGGKLVGNGEKKEYIFNNNGCNETGDALVVESCNYPKGTPTISITGGEFVSVNASAIGSYVGNGATERVTGFVEGGTFHDASVFDYLAPVAEVTLGADITLSDYIEIRDKKLVINLNGHIITHPASSSASYKDVFEVYGTGELTINGEGKVIAEDGYCIYSTGDSKVNLNGGYYSSPVSVVDARKNSSVTINGGEFFVDGSNNSDGDFGQKFTLNLRDKTGNYAGELSEIVVKGGKFYKYNPAASESEPVVTNFVAPGYSAVADGDYYEVMEGIYNETALNAAIVNGAEITLDDDMTIAKAITIPTGITATINLNGFDVTAPNTDVFEVAGTLTIKDTNNEGVVSAGTANPDASVCAVWANGGNVTIDGGHYKAYSDAAGKRNDCIYAGYNADNNDTAGNITINGGKFEYVWPETKNSGLEYNGDMYLLNCADKDLYQTLITVNGGQFKNNAPSYEPTTPNSRTDKEVQLGTNKKVYNDETVVEAAHSGTTDIWYVVK